MKKLLKKSLFLVQLLLCINTFNYATSQFQLEPIQTLSGEKSAPWQKIEKLKDLHPRFPNEQFHPKLGHFYSHVLSGFGTKTPHSSEFLLHFAPNFDKATHKTPILLLHGANDDATRRYAHPNSPLAKDHLTKTGLMQYLSDQGYAVFAISFSHYHGDNIYQGEAVANAITRIKEVLKQTKNKDFKVDIITHSKGAMAARSYLESAPAYYHKKFLTQYRNDVRRVIFQCAPLAGLDNMFRYYLYNLTLSSSKIPAPMGASKLLMYGSYQSTGENYIHSGLWQGQLQMISDQRKIGIPLGMMSYTSDFNQTMNKLYEGGHSMLLASQGLEKARLAGGRMIEVLNEKGLPKSVEFALIAGDFPIIYDERYPAMKIPAGMEMSGKSDGLLYLNSALYDKGLTNQGAKMIGKKVFKLNHVDITKDTKVFNYIKSLLN
ncbi:MAG: hypothetical protein KC646_12925 [Candidatus Cloacimonetes bacterium]|nr:hypothetical protein [Candidatus Cloacimonadota bacterium]